MSRQELTLPPWASVLTSGAHFFLICKIRGLDEVISHALHLCGFMISMTTRAEQGKAEKQSKKVSFKDSQRK